MRSTTLLLSLSSPASSCGRSSIRPSALKRGVHTVVMIRHGESSWNVEKRFTGWCDIPLTDHGEIDAHDAGVLMGERGMKFDVAFTSTLERAWRTCAIALSAAGQSGSVETLRSWKLNERHYGALQGHLKDSPKLTKLFGEEKILEWRRSYNTAPPSLYDPEFARDMGPESFKRATETMNPGFLDPRRIPKPLTENTFNAPRFASSDLDFGVDHRYPSTESLKNCEDRAFGYWKDVIAPRVRAGDRVLIVAHANTIRALVKAVDQVRDAQTCKNHFYFMHWLLEREHLLPTLNNQLLSDVLHLDWRLSYSTFEDPQRYPPRLHYGRELEPNPRLHGWPRIPSKLLSIREKSRKGMYKVVPIMCVIISPAHLKAPSSTTLFLTLQYHNWHLRWWHTSGVYERSFGVCLSIWTQIMTGE